MKLLHKIKEKTGIYMREDKRLDGIDVSQWQGGIDFRQVKESGIRLVYIKATQGTTEMDPEFERNYREADRENLLIGFYHYVMARSVEEAKAEAAFFSEKIKGKRQHARPAMDFEEFGTLSSQDVRNISLHFLHELEERTGIRPVIYSDASNASTVFDDDRLRKYPLWIAEYGVERPNMENPWKRWSGWQYTDTGRVDGISGDVDRDYFRRRILVKEKHTDRKLELDSSLPD